MWRRTIETSVENFKDVSQLMPGDTARLIHSDGVHILINYYFIYNYVYPHL